MCQWPKVGNPMLEISITLTALRCMAKSPLVISPSDNAEFEDLACCVSSGLQAIGQYLSHTEVPDHRPYISPQVVALWHAFCDLGGPLLRQSGPSVELQKCLRDNEWIMLLFSQMDDDVNRRWNRWNTIREAIDGYLSSGKSFEVGVVRQFPFANLHSRSCLPVLRQFCGWVGLSFS